MNIDSCYFSYKMQVSQSARLPPLPPPILFLSKIMIFLTLKWVLTEIGKIFTVMCNLFRIYWGRSTEFIYFYSSLIYSRGTHEIPMRKNVETTKYSREKS